MLNEDDTKLVNLPNMSRRGLFRASGAVLGGLSLMSLVGAAVAETAGVAPLEPLLMPGRENPVRVNFNENALGMSPKAQAAAREAIAKAFRYADAEVAALKELIANMYGLSTEHVLMTHGSAEGIRAGIAAHAGNDVQFVGTELTYDDGPRHAGYAGMNIVLVPHKEDFSFDIDAMKKVVDAHKGASVVYLVNPNNPTSTITPSDEIEGWIKSKPANTVFIVDEAYAEFADDPAFRSVDGLIKAGLDNVLLLKTFSKIYAMAGMRMGYVLATPSNIEKLSRFVGTEDLNYCGACAAAESLQDKEFLALSKSTNLQSRKIITDVLDELGLAYLPSQTNFIFHRIHGRLEDYRKAMRDEHVLVGRKFPPADEWCRLSMGTPAEMAYVANAMRKLRANGAV